MGGIKHGMWGMFPDGGPPKSTGNFQTDQLEWQKNLIANQQTMCKFCGQQVMQSDQDADGNKVDWAWEMQNEIHYRCYMNYMIEQRNQQRGPQA